MSTYSFVNVQATFNGPDATFELGYGSGNAKEGISVEMIEDKDKMDVGADGAVMHSLRASNAVRVTVRLLKTSPTNAKLSKSYEFQRQYAGNWGQNNIRIADTYRGDVNFLTDLAFTRRAGNVYAEDANMLEWVFQGQMPSAVLGE